MKVALVYDRVNKWGGAERVLLALHKIFPGANLFTSVYNPEKAKWASVFKVKPSFLQKFPYASSSHEFFAAFMPIAFESFDFDGYDLVISVTSEAAKGVITKPKTMHVCYCLTPTRYLWSGYREYFKNPLLRFFSKPAVSYLREWDRIASQRPDYYIAISSDVQKRIRKYYNRNSEVIYPPLQLSMSLPSRAGNLQFLNNVSNAKQGLQNDYFLVVSRLVYYKRVDIAIKACNKLNVPLKIIGKGKDEKYLKSIAGKNVQFLKDLTDDELSFYYKNCKALIFPGLEDFGLVMVEAQSFGRPVIAFGGGGALEIVKEGKTGEFFNEQTPESLAKVLKSFNVKRYNTNQCLENAKRFAFDIFEQEFRSFLEKNLPVNKI